MNCFVCKNVIRNDESRVLFGYDGDFIHTSCEKEKDKAMEKIDNMTDEEFRKYLLRE